MCLQLARRGFAIVLISRSQEKLDEISKAICKLFTNPVKMFHLRLSQTEGEKKKYKSSCSSRRFVSER